MSNMRPLTMYECQHCKKIFKTDNRHWCRKNPINENCYSCKHWKHQFVITKGEDISCEPEQVCEKFETSFVDEAFEIMRENGWTLSCPDYEPA